MPTEVAVAIVVALVLVLAAYAVSWFRGGAWPLGVLAAITVISLLTYLFNHATAALVLGVILLGGLVGAGVIILLAFDRMVREEIEP